MSTANASASVRVRPPQFVVARPVFVNTAGHDSDLAVLLGGCEAFLQGEVANARALKKGRRLANRRLAEFRQLKKRVLREGEDATLLLHEGRQATAYAVNVPVESGLRTFVFARPINGQPHWIDIPFASDARRAAAFMFETYRPQRDDVVH